MKVSNIQHGLSQSTVEKICATFAAFAAVDKAVLYGSRAKGNFKRGSDIDLTLFGATLTPQLCATIGDALEELLLPYEIDLSVFETIDNADLRDHIARAGAVFYVRQPPQSPRHD